MVGRNRSYVSAAFAQDCGEERDMELDDKPFELVALIGSGLKSDVYLGFLSPRELSRKALTFPTISAAVAVKVYRSGSHEEVVEEATLMREAAHPNICAVYGLYKYDGRYCLMMEYFIQDLFDFAFSGFTDAIAEPCALSLFTSLLFAVEHLHSNNIVHGDIKLENALITGTKVCLTDFDKARRIDGQPTTWQPGTVLYAAPETLSRCKVPGPEVDMWSLGIVLYCLVEGCFPYYADSKRYLRRVICRGHRYRRASPPLQLLIDSMLSVNPRTRSTSAELLSWPVITPYLPQQTPPTVHVTAPQPRRYAPELRGILELSGVWPSQDSVEGTMASPRTLRTSPRVVGSDDRSVTPPPPQPRTHPSNLLNSAQ